MKQHKKTFKKAETLQMSELLFFNPALSKDELKFEAEGIANFLDNVFRNTYGSAYENGVDKVKAIADMVGILIHAEKTLPDVGETIDSDYNF